MLAHYRLPYLTYIWSAEIKKLIYWDLDKQLRIQAAIGLWPSATGDAPVSHQKPTDEVIALLSSFIKFLPSSQIIQP